ncbi:MAG: D-TA family PLP-dependent enzyme [Chitinophagaceae bacterium]
MHYSELDSPCLIVDPSIVRKNITEMIKMAGDPNRLRPHIKTHKTAEGILLMMEAGIKKFKCATIAEAELLALNGCKDILLAYQPVGPKIERLHALQQLHKDVKFACLVDHNDAAKTIGAYFDQHQTSIEVYVDLNLGMNRTGIHPSNAFDLIKLIIETPGLVFIGLHAYDGHHRQINFEEKEMACEKGFEPVYALVHSMEKEGMPTPIIVAGGSPSFSVHSKKQDRICSPGTNIFWDKGYASICPEQAFTPAVKILTRIISLPSENIICIDLGHKAVASENELSKRIFFPEYPTLKPVSQSEEHMVLETSTQHHFKPGDLLIGIPYHICPTVALHESIYEITDEHVSGEWKVQARKRKLTI